MKSLKVMALFLLIAFFTSCGDGEGTLSDGGDSNSSLRFEENGDGTVTDNDTGLLWMKSPEDITGKKTWEDALYISDTQFQFSSKWRLPNVRELVSLMDYSKSSPALAAGYPFENILTSSGSYYWTSTTDVYNPGKAWCVDLYDGRKVSQSKNSPAASLLFVKSTVTSNNTVPVTGQDAWWNILFQIQGLGCDNWYCQQQDAVFNYINHNGKEWPYPRLSATADGKGVFDIMTNLIWYKNPGEIPVKSWGDAKAYCTNLGSEWRLPTLLELETMLDASQKSPAVINRAGDFAGLHSAKYWTSTQFSGTTDVWCIDLNDGSFSKEAYASSNYLWPVKGPLIGG